MDQFYRENRRALIEYIKESEIFKDLKEEITFFQRGTTNSISKYIADEIERGLKSKEIYLII